MLYHIIRIILTPLFQLFFRVEVKGKENFIEPPAIIAANHSDNADPVFLGMLTKKQIFYIVKHDLILPPTKLRFLHRRIDHVLIERRMGKSQKAIDKSCQMLSKKNYFAIFPEGTIIGKEKILRGHTGVARIALQSKCPVIPIAIINNHNLWPKKSIIPSRLPPKVIMNIGKPMYFKGLYGKQNNRKITRLVTNKIMKEIKKLYKN